MTRTINHMFTQIGNSLDELKTLERGHFKRTAKLEEIAKDMELFLVMAADLAVMVEDLTTPVHTHPQPDSKDADENNEDRKGMYL